MSVEAVKNTSISYPYDLKQGERPDMVSHLYYEIPTADWLIYFSNDVIDPYFDYYLTDAQLTQHIISKYGSLARAQTRIKHYRVNWDVDSSRKTLSAYDALPGNENVNLKKYWRPVVDDFDRTIYYVRKDVDTVIATNKIVSLGLIGNPITAGLQVGEDVFQRAGIGYTARAEIIRLTSNRIYVKNVYGEFDPGQQITSSETDKTLSIASTTTEQYSIPAEEASYWAPVSYYDYEIGLNEKKKTIKIVDKDYLDLAEKNLRTIMS